VWSADALPGIDAAQQVDGAIHRALQRLDRSLAAFTDSFPAPSSERGLYGAIGNVEWTNGFWTGMLWLAWEFTGTSPYREVAQSQVESFIDRVERRNHVDHHDLGFSTFHTFYFDTQTGAPRFGSTHQGFADDSCWARGQAWGIYGFALAYRQTRQTDYLMLAARLANYFLNRLPTDLICCWDLVFTGDQDLRDSSAAAIAACGLIELAHGLPLLHPDRTSYELAALRIIQALDHSYLAPLVGANGLLTHGVYNLPRGIGIDESCLWGDYFYLEALMRLRYVWTPYWRS
jgi:unsaturated chondroitin disaccharide hydrolase